MNGGWFQRVLEQRVIAKLENLTGGRVEIGHFRFKPWLLQITVQNLVIHGREGAGEPPLISAGDVEGGLGLRLLGRQRLRLRHLDVTGLAVHLRTTPQGITNLPIPHDLTSPQQNLARLMNLSIGRLTVSHSVFSWNDQRQPLEMSAGELAILFHLQRGGYCGAISSSAITIRSPGLSIPPVKFNGRFDLSPTGLKVSSLAWQARGTSGEASFTILAHPALQASGFFHASLELPAMSGILHLPELAAGTVQVEGLGSYENGKISARGRAQARQVAILKPSFPSLLVDATTNYALENNQLDLTGLIASVWGGTVQGSVQANLQATAAKFRLDARLRQVRLDNALRVPGAPSVPMMELHPATAADGTLTATWSGQGEGLKASFDLSLRAPANTSPSELPVSGTARGSLENGRGLVLHLADSAFQTPHSSITARGTLRQATIPGAATEPLTLTVATDGFEEWRPFFEALVEAPSGIPLQLMSRAEFSGRLSGSAEAPSLEGRLSVGRFRYQGWTWDRLTASVVLNPEFVQIADARVEHEKSAFGLHASAQLNQWRFTSNSVVRFSAVAQRTPIEGLKAAIKLDVPVRGSLSGRLDVEGTAATLAGAGSMRIDDGAVADEPFDSFSTELQITRSQCKLQNIELVKSSGHLTGEVAFEPSRRFASGHLTGSRFRLAEFHRLPVTASLALPNGRLDGKLNFEVRGQGTPEDFHLQSSWQLRDLSVAGTPLGEFDGSLTGEGNQLKLQGADQTPGGQELHLSARATAKGDWPMEAEGDYSGLRADPWIRAFLNRELAAAVTLDGSFHAEGPLRSPAKMVFQSRATKIAIEFPSVQWRNVQPFDVRYSERRLNIDKFIMRGPSTELEIAGAVDLTNGVTLALSADGSANATLMTLFDPALQASGRSALHLRVTGTPARPRLNGTVNIEDVSVEPHGFPLRFSGLRGVIGLEGERAVIRSLHGTSGGGTVDISGFITVADSPRFDLRADLNQVRLAYPANFTSVLDGRLRLGGSTERAEVQGELIVRQMIVNQNINIIGKIIESSNPMAELPGSVSSPMAAKTRLNVRVTSVPPVQVQTPNFRLVSDIDVRLQGSLADPVQVGSIHFVSGETVFRGNRFTLVRGDINLTNPFRTQAYLDLESQTRVQNYDLTLDITGPFDRMKFAYRSDPPLSQTDIISLLALGYVPQEQAFPALQGNPTSSVGASAILSEALSSQIGGRIQHLFGVSRIKIDPYVGMPGLGSGERVTVEEQITHELTLTYITDTSYSQYTIVQFEWNVSSNVSILGVRDPNGIFGIEFRFRKRFK